MKFYAKNRYLHIEIEEEKKNEEKPLFYVPDEYKSVGSAFKVAKILSASDKSEFTYDIGHKVIFSDHMIEKLEVSGVVYTVIPESCVYGVLREEHE